MAACGMMMGENAVTGWGFWECSIMRRAPIMKGLPARRLWLAASPHAPGFAPAGLWTLLCWMRSLAAMRKTVGRPTPQNTFSGRTPWRDCMMGIWKGLGWMPIMGKRQGCWRQMWKWQGKRGGFYRFPSIWPEYCN
ncbi:hypothetical protein IMSAGC019_03280 [Lachnospiraceae bacterium]|nr:hypothetical protein IMSAGC019_03280 [Lachnospiraceae bacterium]